MPQLRTLFTSQMPPPGKRCLRSEERLFEKLLMIDFRAINLINDPNFLNDGGYRKTQPNHLAIYVTTNSM